MKTPMNILREHPVQSPQRREVTDIEVADNEERRKRVGYAPNPFCPVCLGVGFVHPLDNEGRPIKTSLIPCKAKDCLAEAKAHYLETATYLKIKGVSERLQTFESFKKREGTHASYQAFYDLAHGYTEKPFILCCGANGCGKTHLAQALTITLNRRGTNTHFYPVPNLLQILKTAIQEKKLDDWLDSLATMPALVLDDFGMEYGTDWEMTQLETVINERWQERRITVITTNKTLSDLKEKSPRIFSRMCDKELSQVVANTATDYRIAR